MRLASVECRLISVRMGSYPMGGWTALATVGVLLLVSVLREKEIAFKAYNHSIRNPSPP